MLAAAHIGNDAIGTEIVAAIHDGHPSGKPSRALDRHVLGQRRIAQQHIDDRTAPCGFKPANRRLQLMHLVRSKHEVDVRCTANQGFAFLLRHAARDTKDECGIRALDMLDLADLPVDLVLRRLPHTACIQKNEIGARHILRALVAKRRQLAFHPLRIGNIHLAAIDADKCPLLLQDTISHEKLTYSLQN